MRVVKNSDSMKRSVLMVHKIFNTWKYEIKYFDFLSHADADTIVERKIKCFIIFTFWANRRKNQENERKKTFPVFPTSTTRG